MADQDQVHRNLRLTSPFAHGADVAHLQRALNARLKARRKPTIDADGVYGRTTAQALRDVLWFLGAPSNAMDSGASQALQRVIRRPNTRSEAWKKRAVARRKSVAKADSAVEKLVKAWLAQEGKHEDGNNRGAYVDALERDFHMLGQPWCGAFVGYYLRHVAGIAVPDGIVYTPTILSWAKTRQHGFFILPKPQPGCLVLFKFPGVSNQVCDHVGGATFNAGETAEGNTHPDAGGSQNNGGQVCVKHRPAIYVVAYIGIAGLH